MANYDTAIYDKTQELSALLKTSQLCVEYKEARAQARENERTRALLDEYHRLQVQAQSAMVAGRKDEAAMEQLQKLGELLQFDESAARYLMAEYQLGKLLGDVYKILGEAVGIHLNGLEG